MKIVVKNAEERNKNEEIHKKKRKRIKMPAKILFKHECNKTRKKNNIFGT